MSESSHHPGRTDEAGTKLCHEWAKRIQRTITVHLIGGSAQTTAHTMPPSHPMETTEGKTSDVFQGRYAPLVMDEV